jgi:hypothetical protein
MTLAAQALDLLAWKVLHSSALHTSAGNGALLRLHFRFALEAIFQSRWHAMERSTEICYLVY